MPRRLKIIITLFFTLFLLLGLFNNVSAATCVEAKGTCKNLDCSGSAGAADCDPTCPTGTNPTADSCTPTNYTCCAPSPAPASTVPKTEATTAGYGSLDKLKLGATPVPVLMGRIVKAILSIVGAIALLMVVYGAITMLISRGGEGVKKGKDILIWAAIGSMVVLGSYVLVDYAIKGLRGQGGGATDSTKDKECSVLHPKNYSCAKANETCESQEFAGVKFIQDNKALFCNNDNTLKCCYAENENDCYVKYGQGNSICYGKEDKKCPSSPEFSFPTLDTNAVCTQQPSSICCHK